MTQPDGHDPGASPDEPRVVVRDRRRIDPQTGAAHAPEPVTDPEEDDVQDPVVGPDSAIGGVPTSGTDVAGDDTRSTAADGSLGEIGASEELSDSAVPGTAPQDAGELDRVRTELDERTADLQRVSAEFANYRRRVDRDREGSVASAKAQVAGELLTVLDDVDRAAAHGDLTGPFKVVADRLSETLTRLGLTPFGTEGDAFDPSVHEAVAHETSATVSGPTVTTVMRRGYRFGERVLRPAMVAVTDVDPDAAPGGPAEMVGSPAAPGPDAPDETAGSPSATNPDAV